MTRLQRELEGRADGLIDLTYGYPDGLRQGWMRELASIPVSRLEAGNSRQLKQQIAGWFAARYSEASDRILLANTACEALAVALGSVVAQAGDEIILFDGCFDPYPGLIQSFKGCPVFAPRTPEGRPSLGSLERLLTHRTRAVLITHPDNPLGYVYTRREMETIQDFCYGAGLTLIVDSAFAFVSPYGVDTFGPLEPVRNGRRWILIGDTGKIFDLFGVRCGALVASGELVKPLQARLDQLFYRMDALRLNLLESTLGHELWPQAAQQVNRTVAANYSYLAGHIHPRLRAIRPMAGSLAMVEFDGCSGTTDVELAAMLRWVAGVATVPCSYFVFADSCGGALRNRLRIALARPPEVIRRAVENLNAALLDEPSLIAEPANLLRNTRTTEAGASVVPVRLAGRTGPCSPLSNTLKTECGAKCFWAYGGAHRTL